MAIRLTKTVGTLGPASGKKASIKNLFTRRTKLILHYSDNFSIRPYGTTLAPQFL